MGCGKFREFFAILAAAVLESLQLQFIGYYNRGYKGLIPAVCSATTCGCKGVITAVIRASKPQRQIFQPSAGSFQGFGFWGFSAYFLEICNDGRYICNKRNGFCASALQAGECGLRLSPGIGLRPLPGVIKLQPLQAVFPRTCRLSFHERGGCHSINVQAVIP